MKSQAAEDNPGVVFPPPLIYAAFFLFSILIQYLIPLNNTFIHTGSFIIAGWVLLLINFIFGIPALISFFKSKNTLITVKPSSSLQSAGIYSISRNPMYCGLFFLYAGLGLLTGNLWTIIFIIPLLIVINNYVIKREENYLNRKYGESFINYCKDVRRWL